MFLSSTASRPVLDPTQSPIQWKQGALSQRVKQLIRETEHLPPSSAAVKNVRTVPLFHHTSSWCGTSLSAWTTLTFT
jgi:hypothetical protein